MGDFWHVPHQIENSHLAVREALMRLKSRCPSCPTHQSGTMFENHQKVLTRCVLRTPSLVFKSCATCRNKFIEKLPLEIGVNFQTLWLMMTIRFLGKEIVIYDKTDKMDVFLRMMSSDCVVR